MKLNDYMAGCILNKIYMRVVSHMDALLIFNLLTLLETGSIFLCIVLYKSNKKSRVL